MANSYLMIWICDNGHQNWAHEFKCQECDDVRDVGVKWYLPDPMVQATDAQEKLKGRGPNWFCGSCDSENPVYEDENCMNCGAPIGKAKTNVKVKYPSWEAIPRTPQTAIAFATYEVDHGDAGQGFGPDEKEAPVRTARSSSAKPKAKTAAQNSRVPSQQIYAVATDNQVSGFFETEIGSTGITYKLASIGIAIVTVVALIIWAIWFNYYDTTTRSAWVSSLGWKNNTKVEQYMQLEKTDWDENVPSDAYNSSCVWKVREEDRPVSDGFKDVDYETTCDVEKPVTCPPEGDGAGGIIIPDGCTQKVQEPCTKTKSVEQFHYVDISDNECTYNVMRWQTIGNFPNSGVISVIPASGNSHETPYNHGGYVETPNLIHLTEELGTYTVNFSSEYVKPFSFTYDYGTWLQFDLRETVSIEVNKKNKVPYRPEVPVLR